MTSNSSSTVRTGLMVATAFCLATSAMSVHADTPKVAQDADWISFTGHVSEVNSESINVLYRGGSITVEMDDWQDYDQAEFLEPGDKVTVSGVADIAFFEEKTIEAGSVFDHEEDLVYRTNPADEEGDAAQFPLTFDRNALGNSVMLTGTAQRETDGGLSVVTAERPLHVNTENVVETPADSARIENIDEGDRITVWGRLDNDVLDGAAINASRITVERLGPMTSG